MIQARPRLELLSRAGWNHDTIAEATWTELAARRNGAQLVEIAFVVGQCALLSMVAGALQIPLEEGFARLPETPAGAAKDS